MLFKILLTLGILLCLPGCPGSVVVDTSSLKQSSFELPSGGTPNDNAAIGPFCCTGTTATVVSNSGDDVGYVYFYAWKGQTYNTGPDSSIAPDAEIEIAGLADVHDPQSTLEKGEIDFLASEMEEGASKSATVGELSYTVTIEHVEMKSGPGGSYFDMSSLAVRVDVGVLSDDAG